jgi:hypothetical protein
VGGGKQSADNLDTLNYFVQCLYNSLHVPLGRLNSDTAFSDGENISREELRFAEFIIALQKLWASAIKRTFIVHLKLRGRKLLEQARKYDVNEIKIPSKDNPTNKESIEVTKVFKDNFNNKCWDYYDILVETVDQKIEKQKKKYVETVNKQIERLEIIEEELSSLNVQIITESDDLLIDKINQSRVRLLKEREDSNKTLEYADGKIREIEDEGMSWWEQYDLQEEDIDVKMNEPTQFFQIRQQQIFEKKLDNYTAIASQEFVSATFAQKMWLGMSDDEILANRSMMQKDAAFRWELAQIESNGPDFREKALQEMEDTLEGGGGGLGDLGGGGGGAGGLPSPSNSDTNLPDFGEPPSGENAESSGGEQNKEAAPPPTKGGEKSASPPPSPPGKAEK